MPIIYTPPAGTSLQEAAERAAKMSSQVEETVYFSFQDIRGKVSVTILAEEVVGAETLINLVDRLLEGADTFRELVEKMELPAPWEKSVGENHVAFRRYINYDGRDSGSGMLASITVHRRKRGEPHETLIYCAGLLDETTLTTQDVKVAAAELFSRVRERTKMLLALFDIEKAAADLDCRDIKPPAAHER